ncbi:MAG: chaperonin [Armatimonadetes bacterium]|jgi:chaperonin GroEL (HSP60 family)|nr:chaperonin [Armatimonadota bacterium]
MSSHVKQVSKTTDVDERLAALMTNSSAISSLSAAVEGTIGPKGLDCMLVDKFGDVTVTNDGATILDKIDTAHPAAKMLIRAARAQEEEIGDGTTTTTILAAALIAEGVGHVSKGVPVTRVIEGIRQGISDTLSFVASKSTEVSVNDEAVFAVALIAARGNAEIADMVVKAARLIGEETLKSAGFRLADSVVAAEGAQSEVINGMILDKQRASKQMPTAVENPLVLIVDEALEPPQVENEALATESGFARHIAMQEEFRANIQKLIDLGVGFVATAKGIDPVAEELMVDAGILAVRRLSSRDIASLAALTGARTIKRAGLAKSPDELKSFLGVCGRVYEDERLNHIRVVGDSDAKMATVLIGASTREVKDERQRVARDAAGALQAAVSSGIVPGGGAIEIAALRHVQAIRESARGMAAYGIDCVAAALKKPPGCIVANAGLNPLEKVENLIVAQHEAGSHCLGIDCDTGEIADMIANGIFDPTAVKLHALRTAAEIAEAILRINTIIRKRDEGEDG